MIAFIEVYLPDEKRWLPWCQYSLFMQFLKLPAKKEFEITDEFREKNGYGIICEYDSLEKAQTAVAFLVEKFPQCKDMLRAVEGQCTRVEPEDEFRS